MQFGLDSVFQRYDMSNEQPGQILLGLSDTQGMG